MKKILLALLLLSLSFPALAAEKGKESAYERVTRTRTLRCAYTNYPSFIEKDPNTGKFSGLFYDMTEEIGKQLGLKIEWTEEVGSDALFAGFETGRYDAVCAGFFAVPSRTWGGDFTKPLVFIPSYLFVREKENRFKSYDDFNTPQAAIATLDGEFSQIIYREQFSKAKELSFPGLTPATDRLEAVSAGKADATSMEYAIGSEYIAHNPGKVRRFGDTPLRVNASVLLIPRNEFALKQMLDTAIDTMLWSGATERLVRKAEKYPGSFLLPAPPYRQMAK